MLVSFTIDTVFYANTYILDPDGEQSYNHWNSRVWSIKEKKRDLTKMKEELKSHCL